MAEPFTHRMRVRYGECDPQGVLFNANYLSYVDHTINEMWREAFGSYNAMLDRGVDIVVHEARLRFHGSARFEEEIVIEAVIVALGTTSVSSEFRFRRLDGTLLLESEVRHVFIDVGTAAKTPIPEWAREGLARWHVAPAAPVE
jgi:acyl-CoA thioester hydrolase